MMPTIAMREADEDYAVSFACPSDAEGVTYGIRTPTPVIREKWKKAAST